MFIVKKIPGQFKNEFIQGQTLLVKNRVRLFCLMTLGMYVFVTAVSIVMYPETFKVTEIPQALLLFIGGFVILYLNQKAATLRIAKLNACLFVALVLYVLTRINLIYYEYSVYSLSIYVLILFMATFTIPWMPCEIFAVAFMVFAFYSLFFVRAVGIVPERLAAEFSFQSYFDDTFLLAVATVTAFIIRKREAVRDIDNFILLKDLETKNEQIRAELELATQVHNSLVPHSVSTDLVDIAVTYLPVEYLGGDYARFHFIDKERLIFIISDVTGHGVSAALLVNRLHAEFEQLVKENKDPGHLLKSLNDFIESDFDGTNMYLSAFCGLLHFGTGTFLYSNHGHPAQYLYRVRGSEIISFASQAMLLGMPFTEKKVYQQEMKFLKGDRICLFTDGVTEAMNAAREEYGKERLERFIKSHSSFRMEAFNLALLDDLNAFTGRRFNDDVFLLSIEIKAA